MAEVSSQDGSMLAPALRLAITFARCHSSAELLDAAVSDETLAVLAADGMAVYDLDESDTPPRQLRQGGPRWCTDQTPNLATGSIALTARAARDRRPTVGEDGHQIAWPLTIGPRLRGVLLSSHPDPVPPGSPAWEALATVARLLATALAGVEAYEMEQRLGGQIEVLRRASAAIAERLAVLPDEQLRAAVQRRFRLWPALNEPRLPDFLAPVLQTILEHAMQAVSAQMGAIGISDTSAQPFEPWLFSGVSAGQAAAIGRPPRPVGTLGLVAFDGQVVRTYDLRAHPAFRGLPVHHPDLTTLLGVPIRYHDLNIGNLYLANKQGGRPFTAEDQKVVELLAAQAALSLQQAYFRAAIDVQRTQLQIIFDTAPQGIVFVEARTDQTIVNPYARSLLGPALEPRAARSWFSGHLLGPDGAALPFEQLPSTKALAGETISGDQLTVLLPDGRKRPVILSAAPVRGSGGEVVGAVVTFEDISQLKEIQRLREEFAAVVAHDLRTPIAAISLQAAILKTMRGPEGSPALWAAIGRIESNAARLAEMTNDLLDASRIESGRLTLDRRPIDLAEAARNLVDRLRPTFGRHPVTLVTQEQVPVPALDPLRFDQILGNLLENAAKFSPGESPIEVRIAARDGGAVISVEDHGMGVAPDELPHLFDRFYQSKRARQHRTGLGLGLYITKGLVEAHGGRLWLESVSHRGTTFHIWFPTGTSSSPE
jgi:PAS domain S-box-containing protein